MNDGVPHSDPSERTEVTLAPTHVDTLVQQLRRSRLASIAAGLMMVVVLIAILAPFLAPHDPEQVDIRNRLQPPIWMDGGTSQHMLGTDNVGRDVTSRIIFGARISLLVGGATVLLGGFLGTVLGILAGFFGGRIDTMQRC